MLCLLKYQVLQLLYSLKYFFNNIAMNFQLTLQEIKLNNGD
jgi:hypothetical protein